MEATSKQRRYTWLYNSVLFDFSPNDCNDEYSYLLLIHLKIHNTYEFPGGGVENNENLHQTAIREIIEETGYTIIEINNLVFEQIELHEDRSNPPALFEATN